nr:hypothetical protein [Tanacetum cinerariifolium]
MDASKHGRIADIDANEDINLVNVHNDEDMFGVNDIDGDEVIDENVDVLEQAKEVVDDITLAIKSTKPKANKVLNQEPKKGESSLLLKEKKKRNKPPIQAQQRKITCTYLKNMEGKKLTNLKKKSFDSIQKMFDRAFERVNTFIDLKTELVEESSKKAKAKVMEGSSKRAGTELEQESSKKQKIDDDKETAELKQLVKIIQDEERVAIYAIPLAVKPPSIVD